MKQFCVCLIIAFTGNLTHADSVSTFDFFKSMKGSWNIFENGVLLPIEMTYALGSRDSIVEERFGRELSVFYIDKSDLLMTHFCNRGNQPRLKLIHGGQSDIFEFELVDITNLKSDSDPHVEKMRYKVIDSRRVDLQIIWRVGQDKRIEEYILQKKN